jgi:hypothetical protein
MMMKQEALNVVFGHGMVIPLTGQGHAMAGASLMSSVTFTMSTPSRWNKHVHSRVQIQGVLIGWNNPFD